MIERELELAGPARRHLQEALRINPYFSPPAAPLAEQALAALGEPPDEPVPTGSPDGDDEDNKPSRQPR
jgi:hypothetical protein